MSVRSKADSPLSPLAKCTAAVAWEAEEWEAEEWEAAAWEVVAWEWAATRRSIATVAGSERIGVGCQSKVCTWERSEHHLALSFLFVRARLLAHAPYVFACATGVDGNWRCPSCSNINFGSRDNCNRCRFPKPAEAGPGIPPGTFTPVTPDGMGGRLWVDGAENALFWSHFTLKSNICQDRLGTNIVHSEKLI